MVRRLAGAVATIVLGLAAVVITPSALNGAVPTGTTDPQWEIRVTSVLCDPSLGQWQSSFGFKNGDVGLSLVFTSVVMHDTGAEIVGTFTPNPFVSGQWTDGVAHSPGTAAGTDGGTIHYTADGVPDQIDFPPFAWSSVPCLQVADLVVGPAVAQPGATVTISGTGCLQPSAIAFDNGVDTAGEPVASNGGQLSGTVSGSVAFVPPVAFGPITAAPDGSWSTTVVVPPGTPPGSYPVSATCTYPPLPPTAVAAQATTPTSFSYQTRTITLPVVASPKFAG